MKARADLVAVFLLDTLVLVACCLGYLMGGLRHVA